jgi:AcrR family transcriptional regulator
VPRNEASRRPSRRRSAGDESTPAESPTSIRYEARRREISDAAATLFAQQGYEATSFSDIAEAVGLLKGSLYYYAPSKEDLLYSVIHEVHLAGRELVERNSAGDYDTITQLRNVVGDAVTFLIESREKNVIAMRDYRALSEQSQKELGDERLVFWNYLRRLIERGKAEGTIRADVDTLVVATAILGAINYLPAWYERGRPPSIARMVAGYRDFLIQGLLA